MSPKAVRVHTSPIEALLYGDKLLFKLNTKFNFKVPFMPFPAVSNNPVFQSIVISTLMAIVLIKLKIIIGCLKGHVTVAHQLLSEVIYAV